MRDEFRYLNEPLTLAEYELDVAGLTEEQICAVVAEVQRDLNARMREYMDDALMLGDGVAGAWARSRAN